MPERPPQEPMLASVPRRSWVAVTTVLIVAALAVGGAGVSYILEYARERRASIPPAVDAPVHVRSVRLEPREVPVEVEATGFLYSPEMIQVPSETAGRLREVHVREGQSLAPGDLVATVDAEIHELRLRAARARERGLVADIAFLKKELKRVRELVASDSLGRSELDALERRMERAQAGRLEAKATIAEVELLIRKCRIVAPRAGVWFRERAHAGEYLQPGSPVGELRVIDPLELRIEVSGQTRLALEVGQSAGVELLDVDPTLAGPGAVRRNCVIRELPAGASPDTRRFPVVVHVPNPRGRLVPGLFARATLEIPRRETLLLLPKECVFDWFGKPAVFIVQPSEAGGLRAALRAVEVRELKDEVASWRVAGGVLAGDEVILSPLEQLVDGCAIVRETRP